MIFRCKNIHKQAVQESPGTLSRPFTIFLQLDQFDLATLSQTITSAAGFIRIKNGSGHCKNSQMNGRTYFKSEDFLNGINRRP